MAFIDLSVNRSNPAVTVNVLLLLSFLPPLGDGASEVKEEPLLRATRKDRELLILLRRDGSARENKTLVHGEYTVVVVAVEQGSDGREHRVPNHEFMDEEETCIFETEERKKVTVLVWYFSVWPNITEFWLAIS